MMIKLAVVSAALVAAKQLRFNEKGKFKMVQFTDIHFGEDEPDDLDNMRLIGDILD